MSVSFRHVYQTKSCILFNFTPLLNHVSNAEIALFLLADLPEGDPKLQVEKTRYAVGDTLRGNCSSPASSPPTNLTWIVNGKRASTTYSNACLTMPVAK
jgi:hypothetical protein